MFNLHSSVNETEPHGSEIHSPVTPKSPGDMKNHSMKQEQGGSRTTQVKALRTSEGSEIRGCHQQQGPGGAKPLFSPLADALHQE